MLEEKNRMYKSNRISDSSKNSKKPNSQYVGTEKSCYKDTSALETQIRFERTIFNDQIYLEQIIGQAIRNYFNDPQNNRIIAECLVQYSDQKKSQYTGPLRDISNNEIIRPRDLPQITGLSRTTIHRLEKINLFVKKLKLSNGCVGYDAASVRVWIANRQIIKGE